MRAVLDTNVVMSAIFFGGVPFDVLNAWHDGEFELVVSDAVMEEYREIAARMKRLRQMQKSSVLAINTCWPVTDGMVSKF